MRTLLVALVALLVTIAAQAATDANNTSPVAPPARSALPYMQLKTDTEQTEQFTREVKAAWLAADYKKLETLGAEVAPTLLKTASGRPMLYQYTTALSDMNKIEWADSLNLHRYNDNCNCPVPDPQYYAQADKLWDALDARYDAWLKQFPASPYALVARAQLKLNRGWFYRGAGYSNTIPKEALPIFADSAEDARKLLFENFAARLQNPAWYGVMFKVAGVQQWEPADLERLLNDFQEHGHGYLTAAANAMGMMQPKWGGSYAAMDQFARSVANHNPEPGQDLYTRLYWSLADSLQRGIFKQSRASWPRMNSDFADMIKVYPDPLNLNAYAYFACIAGDYAVVGKVLDMLGDSAMASVWEDGSYAWCRRHAGK